jgi:hypothetical protein
MTEEEDIRRVLSRRAITSSRDTNRHRPFPPFMRLGTLPRLIFFVFHVAACFDLGVVKRRVTLGRWLKRSIQHCELHGVGRRFIATTSAEKAAATAAG